MKKYLTFLCALLLLLTAAPGCSGRSDRQTAQGSGSSAQITLNFISSWGGNDPNADAVQKLLNQFCEENPNIKISNQSVFGDDFLPYLKTAFVSGNVPDVFGIWPGSDINSMIAADKVADLTGLLNSDPDLKSSFGADMWPYVTYNNKIYGLPIEIVFEGLFINKDLFDKYNVPIPTTFDELVNAVKLFNSHNIVAIAYNNTAEGTYIYQNIAASIGGKAAIENPFSTGNINNCYIKAMEDMRKLYELHAFPSDYLTIDSNARNELFKEKKAAMIVQGSWFTSEVSGDPNVELVRFPNCSDDKSAPSRIIYGLGNGIFHISAKTWNNPARRQAAVKLLKFIASRSSAAYLASQSGMVSNVSLREKVSYNRLTLQGLSLIKSSSELVGPPDSYISRPAWQNVIVNEFPYMLDQSKSPQQVWNDAVADGAKIK